MSRMKSILIFQMTFFISALSSLAVNAATPSQPIISGTVAHGGVVTVTGSGFGVKSPVAPRFWDSVNDSYTGITNGGVVPVGIGYPWTAWTQNYPVHFKTTNSRGKFTAKYTNTGTIGQGKAGLNYPNVSGTPSEDYLYISWWLWQSNTNACNNSNKWTRLQDDNSFDTQSNPVVWEPGVLAAKNYNLPQTKDIGYSYYYGSTCTGNSTWKRMEQAVDNRKFPSPSTIWIAENNQKQAGTPKTLPFSFSHPVDTVYMLGFDGSNTDTADQPTVDWGEIYIDDTPARVEICNALTQPASTHCEIQLPQTIWIDNKLQIKVNQGSFPDKSAAYLYVIDAGGNVSPGTKITFGTAVSSSSVETNDLIPPTPTGFSMANTTN